MSLPIFNTIHIRNELSLWSPLNINVAVTQTHAHTHSIQRYFFWYIWLKSLLVNSMRLNTHTQTNTQRKRGAEREQKRTKNNIQTLFINSRINSTDKLFHVLTNFHSVFFHSLSFFGSVQLIWSLRFCCHSRRRCCYCLKILKYLDSHIHWKAKQSPSQHKPPPNSVWKCRSMFKFKCMTTKKNLYWIQKKRGRRITVESTTNKGKKKVVSFHYEIVCIDSFSVRSLLSLSIYFSKDTHKHTPFTLVVIFFPVFFSSLSRSRFAFSLSLVFVRVLTSAINFTQIFRKTFNLDLDNVMYYALCVCLPILSAHRTQ